MFAASAVSLWVDLIGHTVHDTRKLQQPMLPRHTRFGSRRPLEDGIEMKRGLEEPDFVWFFRSGATAILGPRALRRQLTLRTKTENSEKQSCEVNVVNLANQHAQACFFSVSFSPPFLN